ncbi:hypothetical protein Caci_2819 [Catenulispora acidiphila DSM 44928]|uniref:Uncharacterized protein n=1 Tax=Catenulispora acidiphila (strain DSM 44928 / JCM 14897 / NBRC 102108 / NRRL B-24433 / ID139908) TaxID=479433 RepID=C7Q153_CATAD|nr:hypothetical protein [Catenulispora acidiphila]ACU71728.1 hypothetical protein Caci_2819 [Catenulispora acidiphila DSM 44928]
MSHLLGHLRDAGLIVRNRGTLRGAHTRYSATELGTGLVGALRPVTDWAVADFGFVVAATRVRLGLAPLDGLVPTSRCQERSATNMAINLLAGLWTNVLMVYVDSAGEGGIGPQSLEEAVNGDIKASSGEGRVVRPLPHGTMHATLKALVARGLLLRVEYPPQVRYSLSTHGRGLMDAWWQVADTWGIANDNKLFRIVAKTSGWFQSAEG